MRSRIATILLRAGNPGWYDSLTNIHLTIARPQAYVYEGSNTINIKNAVNHGLINVIEGSLNANAPIIANNESVNLVRESEAVEEIIPTKVEEVEAEVIEVVEEIAEEKFEEEVEEKPKKKTTKKKATVKKETEK